MKTIYNGKILKLCTKKINFPDGHSSVYEFVFHKPAVAIIPFLDDSSVILVKQFRPVINKYLWELPAGFVNKNETLASAARRELEEETGFRAKKIIKLGSFFSSPGFTDEKITFFIAKDLVKTKQNFDPDEDIEVKIFNLSKIFNNLKKITDGKTLIGLLLLKEYLK